MAEALERAKMLLERGDGLLEEARRARSEALQLILLAAAAEAYSASILALTPRERRRGRLCERSTKRIFSTALMDLRRLQLVGHEEMERMKRVLQTLRCHRNRLLHPWDWCLEECNELSLREAWSVVERLGELARRALAIRAGRLGALRDAEETI